MLVLGVGIGLANGLIITKLRVNAFIATLGIGADPQRHHRERLERPAGGVPDGSSENLGYTRFGLIPMSFFLLAVVAVIVWFVLRNTRFGYRDLRGRRLARTSPSSPGLRTHRTIIARARRCAR